MTIDMKIRTVPNVTSATRCYAIPLGENAKPFQNDITGFWIPENLQTVTVLPFGARPP